MADQHLELDLAAPEVTLSQLVSASSVFAALIREVAREYAGTARDPVKWVVDVKPGSVKLPVRGEAVAENLRDDAVDEIVSAVINGMATLDDRPERPPYFNDRALEQAKALANLATDELSIVVHNGGRSAPATKRLMTHVDEVMGPPRESIGTVEGKLEAIDVHARPPRFAIFDLLTDKRLDCFFGSNLDFEQVSHAIKRRVAVAGIIKTRPNGERVSIDARELRIFPAEEELPTPDDVLGILRDSDTA